MKLTKGLAKAMAEAALGYVYRYEYLPWGNEVREKIYTQSMILEFVDGQLISWAKNKKIQGLPEPVSISSKFESTTKTN